jgi:hypothetical protein
MYRVEHKGAIYCFSRDVEGAGYWSYAGGKRRGIVGVIVHLNLSHELTRVAVEKGVATVKDFNISPPKVERVKSVRVAGPRTRKNKSGLMGSFNPFEKTNIRTDDDEIVDEVTEGAKIVSVRRKKEQVGFFDGFFGDDSDEENTEEFEVVEIESEIISGE